MGRKADARYYISELRSDECICGSKKKPGNSLCYHCYKSLPKHMQQDLYQRMGNGYEEAYERAVAQLITDGRI